MGELALTEEIKTLGLEKHAEELERDGLTIVPPEVNGFGMDRIDEIVELILARAREMTGCTFTLDGGPQQELEFPRRELTPEQQERLLLLRKGNERTQFLIQKLTQQHRLFRDLALNPASLALQNFMMAGQTRLSSVNCFVKWKGDFGYGPKLGLHADQGAIPTPWGAVAHTANSTWCLTEYTLEGGALAWVPGSHREGKRAPPPERVKDAIPAEAPKGSLIVWHGATWHGAFPRKEEGLRLGLAVYHRHAATLPQEDVPGQTTEEMVQDCENPEVYRVIAGLTDKFPYREKQSEVIPKVKGAPVAAG
jgi:ectoine hydroxylase-related dioxygenase (phytanoyl-CoA dioxygenase family)